MLTLARGMRQDSRMEFGVLREEIGVLRGEIRGGQDTLRKEMKDGLESLRAEMKDGESLRAEMTALRSRCVRK